MKLRSQDLEALETAKQIIMKDYRWNISIYTLSHRVCINERKLKEGFRQIYNISVHAYLIQIRMEKAIELLSFSDKPIEMVAKMVGYKNRSSFSREFKKFYGKPPSLSEDIVNNKTA
ncbi:MAG: AraC family transcriptional regulator [Candidatus Pseudobacter hemicellulosilyticus]|uniref:AraC family transcriptional regulator n=1 Tax=Candidatus Pseudobacter hemicellulosilyticus TaxID=3121375 RepID=A0AAJ5WU43_9BACT|nr:MAG: AraC family transcriptional regulator [Pseudobacter sp.]